MTTIKDITTRLKRVVDPSYMRLRDAVTERLNQIKASRRARVDDHGSVWEKGYNDALDDEIDYLESVLEEHK